MATTVKSSDITGNKSNNFNHCAIVSDGWGCYASDLSKHLDQFKPCIVKFNEENKSGSRVIELSAHKGIDSKKIIP